MRSAAALVGGSPFAYLVAGALAIGAPAAAANAQATTATPSAAEASPAAPPAATEDSGDIVVTAQRRSERLQDVPVSVVAFNAATLERAGVRNVLDLVRITPGFTATRSNQPANLRLNIRGVGAFSGTAAESSIASFIDGVYVPRAGSTLGSLFDVESVEVLRGPQGTLFGRNASVGAILVSTRRPEHDFGGYIEGEYASFGTRRLTGAVNVPLGDRFAVRVAGIGALYDGYGFSLVNNRRHGGINTYGVRGTLVGEITPSLNWTVRVDHIKQGGDGAPVNEVNTRTVTPAARASLIAILGANIPELDNQYDGVVNNYVDGASIDDRQTGITSDLSLDVSGYTLRLLNGYRDWDYFQVDIDQLFLPISAIGRNGYYESTSQSHELQLTSPSDQLLGGRLSFVTGLYYFDEDYRLGEDRSPLTDNYCSIVVARAAPTLLTACRTAAPGTRNITQDFTQNTKSVAGYFQAKLNIVDGLSVTGGIRYSRDRKKALYITAIGNPSGAAILAPETTNLRFKDGRFSYRANVSYEPSRDLLFFANYTTGFKSGGFNSGKGTTVLGQRRIFQSETVTNYELGAKTQFLDRKVTVNATAFRMDVKGYQDRSFNGTTFTVSNAGDIRQQGVEIELGARPSRTLSINYSLSYLDSKFTDFPFASPLPAFSGTQNLTGKRNNFSPALQGNLGVQWDPPIPGSELGLSFRFDLSHISDQNVGGVTNNDPSTIQDGYALLSANIRLVGPKERWSIALFGTNLTDQGYCTYMFAQSLDSVFGLRDRTTGQTMQRCVLAPPRTIGVRGSVNF